MQGDAEKRYRIESVLSRGAYGMVYRVWDRKRNGFVALKKLHEETASAEDRERLRREAHLLACLRHLSIVRVFEFIDAREWPYFTMEFLEGGTLAERIHQGPCREREVAQIGGWIAGTIAFLHRRRIFHRDLKPTNIMLTSPGPVLIDFGLAVAPHLKRITEPGALIGTPAYMAPEVLTGGGCHAGEAADIYSLGAVLYEMIMGISPFWADGFAGLLEKVLGEDPLPPRLFPEIVMQCLQKDPARRPSTAAEVSMRLRNERRRTTGPISVGLSFFGDR